MTNTRDIDDYVDFLEESPGNALKVCDNSVLGPRYYTMNDGTLIHHPGISDGQVLGVVGPTGKGKLSLDCSEYELKKVSVKETPF